VAWEAETAWEELTEKEAVAFPNKKDAVTAFWDQLAVPKREAVTPLVTFRDPDTCELSSAIRPLRATNSFAIKLVL
jgi:hypothetical protein